MSSIYWYTHRGQIIFAFVLLLLLSGLVVSLSITKSDTEKYYEGRVQKIVIESSRGLAATDLILTVELTDGRLKKIRGRGYNINEKVKIRCVKTYFFNAESCHLVLQKK